MMKKNLLVMFFIFTLLLAACAGGGTPAVEEEAPAAEEAMVEEAAEEPAEEEATAEEPAAGEPVVVTFWHGQAGALGELLQTRIDEFNTSYPDIEVQAEFIGNWSELNQKIMSSATTGALPTLAQVGVVSYTDFYNREGLIQPVQDFLDLESSELLDDIYPGFIEENTYDDVLVSWPFGKAVTVLYYNPDILAAAGIDAPAKTWDEFASQLTLIREDTDAKAGWAWTPEVSRTFTAMLWSYGGELLADDWSTVRFNEPEGVEVLEKLVAMVESGDMYTTRAFDWQTDFANGLVGYGANTIVSRPYILAALEAFELGVADLPAGPAGNATELYGPNAVIFADTPPEAQAAAWEFLKWWSQTENTVAWSVESCYVPILKSVAESDEYAATFESNSSLEIGVNSLPYARPMPNRAEWAEIEPLLVDAINKALLGQMSAQDALDEAAESANTILAK